MNNNIKDNTNNTNNTGALLNALTRNNTAIKRARAEAINEDAEIVYKRKIEDLIRTKQSLRREREAMLDLSGDNAFSLKLATNFDATEFMNKDLEIGINIRNIDIQLEILQERYRTLFNNVEEV